LIAILVAAAALSGAGAAHAATPPAVQSMLTAGGYTLTHGGVTSKRGERGRVAIELANARVARLYASLYALKPAALEHELEREWRTPVTVTRVRAWRAWLLVDVLRR
jgi:hypothetical protein